MFSVPGHQIPNFGTPTMGGVVGPLSSFPNVGLPTSLAGQPLTGMDPKGNNTGFKTNEPTTFNLSYTMPRSESTWTIGEAQLLFLRRDENPDTKYQEFTPMTLSHLNNYLARPEVAADFQTGAEVLHRFPFFGLCEKPLAPGLNNGKGDYAERLRREHPGMSSGGGYLGSHGSNRSTVIVDGPGKAINIWASKILNCTSDINDRKLSYLHLVLRKIPVHKGKASSYFDPYAAPSKPLRKKKKADITYQIGDVDEPEPIFDVDRSNDVVNPAVWQFSPCVTHSSPTVDPSLYTVNSADPEKCWMGGPIRVGQSHWIHPGTPGEETGLHSFVHAQGSPDYLQHLKTLPTCEVIIEHRRVLY